MTMLTHSEIEFHLDFDPLVVVDQLCGRAQPVDEMEACRSGENFLWRKCDNPSVSIIWFSYNTFFNVRSQLSQPDLDWNRQNSSNSDATWCK